MTAKILTQAKAEVIVSTIRMLNNAGVICGDLTLDEGVRVQWLENVTIRDGLSGPREEYADLSAFASAYSLPICTNRSSL